MPTTYSFRNVTVADLPRLADWRATPAVRAWWGDDEMLTEADLGDPRVARSIVTHHGTPFAYIQDYDVHGWEAHHFAHLPPGSRGIDQYIGVAQMLGQGHGPRFIKAHVQTLIAAGAPVVATDPHPGNARAISAYRKAGFRQDGPERDTPWGPILPMVTRG